MGLKILFGIPLLALAFFLWMYIRDSLTIFSAISLCVLTVAVYILSLAGILGLFKSYPATEIETGPYTYYYRAYQATYREAAERFHGVMSESQHSIIHTDKSVLYFALYWDDPYSLEDPNQCRSCVGYALPKEATKTSAELMEGLGLAKVELPHWRGAEATFPIWLRVGYHVAPLKLIPSVYAYVATKAPDYFVSEDKEYPIYERCSMRWTAYGLILGEEREVLAKLLPFKRSKLNAQGEENRKKLREKVKKTA